MNLLMWKKLLVAAVVFGGIYSAVSMPALLAQKPETKAAAPGEKKATKRLPNFFKDVVDGEQKEKLYALQEKFDAQIATLTEQVKALQKQRDTAFEALLSAEQKTKLEKLRADSKAKALEKAAAIKAAAEKAKSGAPATAKPVESTPAKTTPTVKSDK